MPTAPVGPAAPQPWSAAWARAAYGSDGFYVSGPGAQDGPGGHFRTSVHVGAVFHAAIAALLLDVDRRLGRPERLDLLDVGAGRGELVAGVLGLLPPEVASRTRAVCVDVRPRPAGLDRRIGWVEGRAPDDVPRGIRGLVVAQELLDDVPLDVVEVDSRGAPRLVLVDPSGTESVGPRIDDGNAWHALGLSAGAARAWVTRWWPDAEAGQRIEVGASRDRLWLAVVARVEAGTALAIDYGHTLSGAGRPRHGTLAAFRDGALVAAVPDGRSNLTAHVAVDSVAIATGSTTTRQREALQALGVTGRLPDHSLARSDPAAYADALGAAAAAAELLDRAGLGRFHWIRRDV